MFFNQKLIVIKKDIEDEISWYSSITDGVKKPLSIFRNKAVAAINKLPTNEKIIKNDSPIDERRILEKILQERLPQNEIIIQLNTIIDKAFEQYKKKWKKTIDASTTVFYSNRNHQFEAITKDVFKLQHQMEASEQVLGASLGSAIIGTVGLAAGWHTLGYAMLNVFPPIAVFAAVATVATAALTKNNVIDRKKQEAQEAVDRYLREIYDFLEARGLDTNNGNTLFNEIDKIGKQIERRTLIQWTSKMELSTDDIQRLLQGFEDYIRLLESEMDRINREITTE
ncbi:hypothetical protein [Sporolactobacillus spathodeae]|uniref:SLATT domain-containing protein n=1 Tax=Sporolactobacillus spathodeae TaxID=1465502 RepID=A0ABS2Q758_9BACL|nr:hypothetical protein [Sporolactobacillus spathodeae]MBM7657240.1 hypothetical protein [Sporolactobacillus spathodeae]